MQSDVAYYEIYKVDMIKNQKFTFDGMQDFPPHKF